MSHRAGNDAESAGSPAPGPGEGAEQAADQEPSTWATGDWAVWEDQPGWWRGAGQGSPPAGGQAAAAGDDAATQYQPAVGAQQAAPADPADPGAAVTAIQPAVGAGEDQPAGGATSAGEQSTSQQSPAQQSPAEPGPGQTPSAAELLGGLTWQRQAGASQPGAGQYWADPSGTGSGTAGGSWQQWRQPPPPRRSHKTAAVTGISAAGVIVLAAVLFFTGVLSPAKAAVPGFHPTTTRPALAARQTAQAFLTAWQQGRLTAAAGLTNHDLEAKAGLAAYQDGLHLQNLHLAVRTATRTGKVTFSVKATVGITGTKPETAAWTYNSQLTAFERRGGWWVQWDPALVAPNVTTTTKVVALAVPPAVGEVTDGGGNDLASDGDAGLTHITGLLKAHAPTGGTPGVEVVLSGPGGVENSTADVLRQPGTVPALKTTIDPGVEQAALAAVQTHPASAMVVLQPSTGAILAIANNNQQNDTALTGMVAPGSTDKIITSAALFTSGLVSSPSQPVACPPQLVINGNTFKNDQGESEPASTPFITDFAASCNDAFAQWYTKLGPGTLAQTAQKYFGLNQPWDIGIGSSGKYYSIPATAYNGELAQELFGQGKLEASPLAMASVAATVANGSFKQPIIVLGQKQVQATPLPANVDQDLQQMMQAVTQSGGTAAGVFNSVGSQVYAKTGTADVGSGQEQPNSWLVAYDPTLDVAVGCLVLDAGQGASVAGPEVAGLLQTLGQQ